MTRPISCFLVWIAFAATARAAELELVPGLTVTEYPRHEDQVDEATLFLEPAKLVDPVGKQKITKSLDPWTWTAERNAIARGQLIIPRDGDYTFFADSFYDRNLLMIDGKVVCGFRDGAHATATIPLKKGTAEICVVGYVGSRGSAKVLWRPPGQKELRPIPLRALMTQALPPAETPEEVRVVVKELKVEVYHKGVRLPDATVEFDLRKKPAPAQSGPRRKGAGKGKGREADESERPRSNKKDPGTETGDFNRRETGPAPLLVESPPRWTVQVLSATYGTGGKNADVTERVARLVEERKRFSANPVDLGADPNPGWNKSLHIVYLKDGVRRVQRRNENETILPESFYGPQDAAELRQWLVGTRWTGPRGEIQFHPSGLLAGAKLEADAQWEVLDSRKIRLRWKTEETSDYQFDFVWSSFRKPDDGKDGYRMVIGGFTEGRLGRGNRPGGSGTEAPGLSVAF